MSGAEVSESNNLILGIYFIASKCLKGLFDYEVAHYFMSNLCVDKLGLQVRNMHFELMVSTPTSKTMLTLVVCAKCPVVVEGCRFKVNLICLPLQGLDVIFRMDWLFANHILIDYGQKRLMFPEVENLVLVSTHQVMKELRDGL